MVRAKARAAQALGLTAVICLGESLDQREGSNTLDIIAGQLAASLPDNCTAEEVAARIHTCLSGALASQKPDADE
jgi:triosephosphate isomerase